jgi:predicted outer membrane protein
MLVAIVIYALVPAGYSQSNPTPAGKDRSPQTPPPSTSGERSQSGTSAANNPMMTAIEMNVAEVETSRIATTKATNPRVKQFAEMMVKDHTGALAKLRGGTDATGGTGTTGGKGTPGTSGGTATPGTSGGTATPRGTGTAGMTGDMKMNAKHQQEADRLSKLSGAEFDREYMKAMVNDHQEAVRFFEQHAGPGGQSGRNDASTNPSGTSAPGSAGSDRTKAGGSDQKSGGSTSGTPSGTATMSGGGTDLSKIAQELLPTVRRHLELAQEIQKELQGSGTQPAKKP